MKITAIHIHWLRLPLPPQVADAMTNLSSWDFIAAQVDTDDGLTGWGYNCTIGGGQRNPCDSAIKGSVTPFYWA